MEEILSYLKQTYDPLAIILYGSYADGSNNEHSDLDALVIAKDHPTHHDVSIQEGIQLDVFVYPRAFFESSFDCMEVLPIMDGRVVMDTEGLGLAAQNRVRQYFAELPAKSPEEVKADIQWCRKMLLRAQRGDMEGMFRWHWLLTESLEIFCDAVGRPFLGPKKSLRWMEREYSEAYRCYEEALSTLEMEALERWIDCLEQSFEK